VRAALWWRSEPGDEGTVGSSERTPARSESFSASSGLLTDRVEETWSRQRRFARFGRSVITVHSASMGWRGPYRDVVPQMEGRCYPSGVGVTQQNDAYYKLALTHGSRAVRCRWVSCSASCVHCLGSLASPCVGQASGSCVARKGFRTWRHAARSSVVRLGWRGRHRWPLPCWQTAGTAVFWSKSLACKPPL
jgi:hypothetical protein